MVQKAVSGDIHQFPNIVIILVKSFDLSSHLPVFFYPLCFVVFLQVGSVVALVCERAEARRFYLCVWPSKPAISPPPTLEPPSEPPTPPLSSREPPLPLSATLLLPSLLCLPVSGFTAPCRRGPGQPYLCRSVIMSSTNLQHQCCDRLSQGQLCLHLVSELSLWHEVSELDPWVGVSKKLHSSCSSSQMQTVDMFELLGTKRLEPESIEIVERSLDYIFEGNKSNIPWCLTWSLSSSLAWPPGCTCKAVGLVALTSSCEQPLWRTLLFNWWHWLI